MCESAYVSHFVMEVNYEAFLFQVYDFRGTDGHLGG